MRRNWELEKYRPLNQANLFGKTLAQIRDEKILKEDIENLKLETARIDHLRKCERCMVEVTLSIERYFGRTLPWYLNLINDVAELGEYEDCPKAQNYELGYYGNDFRPGTAKFIKARLMWAEKVIAQELNDREETLNNLSNLRSW